MEATKVSDLSVNQNELLRECQTVAGARVFIAEST
jgi:hypothetical protein